MKRLAATAVRSRLRVSPRRQSGACAQDYPSRPIKLILPQPPGGAVDLIARTLGELLSEQMSQPVIVENRPGANGGLAGSGRRPLDARRLHAVRGGRHQPGGQPTLYPDLTYDPFRDFAPISVLTKTALVLVANPKVPANNVRELIAYAKANPGQAQLCLDRAGHPAASWHGAIQVHDQDRHQSGRLSWHCRRHDGRGRRSRRHHDYRPAVGQRPCRRAASSSCSRSPVKQRMR